MAKKRKAKKKAKKKVAKSKKRAAPARKKKVVSKRRAAKTKLPPRGKAPSASWPMTQPGPAVTPIVPRPSRFPSSVPGDLPTNSPDSKN